MIQKNKKISNCKILASKILEFNIRPVVKQL